MLIRLRAPGATLSGWVSRVVLLASREAEACAPNQPAHCLSLLSGPLWAEMRPLPAKAPFTPLQSLGPVAVVRSWLGREWECGPHGEPDHEAPALKAPYLAGWGQGGELPACSPRPQGSYTPSLASRERPPL